MVQMRWGVVCIKGNFRQSNQDSYYVDPQGRFFIVADGMGGQAAGDRASKLATDLVPKKLTEIDFDRTADEQVVREQIDEAIRYANREIMSLGELDSSCKGMGTTIVLQMLVGGELFVGNVGDSRAYLLREGKLSQLTKDHTVTAALVESGTITEEDAKTHRYQNMLHRYLGTSEANKGAEMQGFAPQSGDRLLLCSDGVTGGVEDDQLAELIAEGDDPQASAEKIVKAAEAGGSKDNITAIVVHVD